MSKNLKGIIIGVFIVLLCSIVGVIAVKAANKDKSETLGSISYEIGAFDVTDGAEKADDHSLRSKFIEAKRFEKAELSADAKVTYTLYYFNADKEFIGKSEALTAITTELPATQKVGEVTENVKYFRVVITIPESEEKATLLNKGNYVKQLTVTLKNK